LDIEFLLYTVLKLNLVIISWFSIQIGFYSAKLVLSRAVVAPVAYEMLVGAWQFLGVHHQPQGCPLPQGLLNR
jgi:hypothetical protein